MKRLPQRTSLLAQTTEVLREAIESGQWPKWLPGEIELARRLHVSRVTVRGALAQLEREKVVSAGQGKRREILAVITQKKTKVQSRTVVLLSPEPLHRFPPSTVFWMDELREHLSNAGWTLEIYVNAAAYRRRPVHAIEELAARLNPAAWVLFRSTPEMQQWFSERAFPCVIIGSRHSGVALPSVDKDHRAASRHAAGRFLALGHRRMAILHPQTQLAGDFESIDGFCDGAAGAEVEKASHDGTVAGIAGCVRRMCARKERPTALFVFQAAHVLSVMSALQNLGIKVPRDVSVIARDDESFLEFVLPAPTRYSLDAVSFARKASRVVADLVAGAARPREHLLVPDFVCGETLASAPA